MCGIAGFSGNFDRELLDRMNDVQAHRGPDDADVWYDAERRIGLAHRRLTIIDLSALGRQPMWDVDRRAVIAFNGEIYNYRELRAELEGRGVRFRSHSDTEVLLNLYLLDGQKMLSRLNGIFAFAIYEPARRTLFLARDQLGIKPLYYAEPPGGFVFASEMKSLMCAPGLDKTIDADAVRNYMTYLWCPAPRTMLRFVQKLQPGHAMVVTAGRIEKRWQYYELPTHSPDETMSEEEAISQVEHQVRTSVGRQMVADVPVGSFLSGGLDSSSIVSFAREATEHRLQCFTIGFRDDSLRDEGIEEDLPYAQKVAEHLGVDLHTVYVETPQLVDNLEKMIYHLDEPQADPAPLNVFFICEMARQNGMKVLLSGAGGDDIFSGYRRHYALQQEKFWAWMPRPARKLLRGATGMLPHSTTLGRRLAKGFRYAELDSDARIASYFEWMDPEVQRSLYGPYLDHAGSFDRPLLDTLGRLPDDMPALNRMLFLDTKHFLTDHNLNYTDKMAMATGVEVRVPLIDVDLVNLASRIPVGLKQRGNVGKWIFKKAMEAHLPADVIYRSKSGFAMPLRRWLRNELRPVVEDVLSDASLSRRGLFDPQGVRELVARDRAGKIDGAYTILSMICVELWCRLFIDRQTV